MPDATLHPPPLDACTNARVLVVVAHPDDEVVGCGGLLASLTNVRIVHVTDGAPRDGRDGRRHGFTSHAQYAGARRDEALAGLALANVPPDRVTSLAVADQSAAEHLVQITRALAPLVANADVVLSHAYEGGHPDHDAVAFAMQAACRLHPSKSTPKRLEMPFYYGTKDGWMRQRFVPTQDRAATEEIVLVLTPAEQRRKRAMFDAHRSQADTLQAFACDAERFRRAPVHDFARRPHAGPLLYERHAWNLTWPQWRSRVETAVATLGLGRA